MKTREVAVALLVIATLTACSGSRSQYGGFKVGKPYQVAGVTYTPEVDYSYNEVGIASWYGPGFHGNDTANGAEFNTHKMTAAHKTLPLPCYVSVTNLDNGRSAVVLVNDRGPFVEGRIIDLSKAAAQKLGVIGTGTARVRVQFLKDETENLWSSLGVLPQARRYAKGSIAQQEYAVRNPQYEEEYAVRSSRFAEKPAKKKDDINTIIASNLSPVSSAQASEPIVYIQAGAFGIEQNALSAADKLTEVGATNVEPVMSGDRRLYRLKVGPFSSAAEARKALDFVKSVGLSDARMITNY